MNIYLDIDGVILTKDGKPAKYLEDFLKFVTQNHNVYWLTTHCKGDAKYTLNYLSRFLDKKTLDLLKTIKPTTFNTLKTEAIDFTKSFLWLDDYILNSEKKALGVHSNNWVQVDLKIKPDQLQDLLDEFDFFHSKNVTDDSKLELIDWLRMLTKRLDLVDWIQKDLRVAFARWIGILRQLDTLNILDPEMTKGSILLGRKINHHKLNKLIKEYKVV